MAAITETASVVSASSSLICQLSVRGSHPSMTAFAMEEAASSFRNSMIFLYSSTFRDF